MKLTDQQADIARESILAVQKLAWELNELVGQFTAKEDALSDHLNKLNSLATQGEVIKELDRLRRRLERITELRRIQEMGSFTIEVDRAMEITSEKLCAL